MFGPEAVFNPGSLLAMWAAGITGAAAVVVRWRIVGPGYLWLAVTASALVGAGTWFFEPSGCGGGVAGGARCRRGGKADTTGAILLAVSAALYLFAATSSSLPAPALTGALHWGESPVRCCSGIGTS